MVMLVCMVFENRCMMISIYSVGVIVVMKKFSFRLVKLISSMG